MATFRDLQDRISLDYLNRTDLAAEVKRAIRASIRDHEAGRYWFNTTATTTTATINSTTLSVPADFMVLDRLEIAYSGARLPLQRTSLAEVRSMNAVSATSVPTHFTYYGDHFELALLPDAAYPITIYYQHSLPALSADSDSNAWTNEAANLIAHTATIELLSSVIDVPDDRKLARHLHLLQIAANELHSRNGLRLATPITPTQF